MSELTRCNHCTLEGIQRRHQGQQITLKSEDGWTVCYVDGERVASFMELTEECVC